MRHLITMMDEINKGLSVDDAHEKYTTIAREKSSNYGDVIGSPGVMQMVVQLWPMRSYFSNTKMMRVHYLKKKVIGTNVGVSEFVIVRGLLNDGDHAAIAHVLPYGEGV
jgi:hypothetical protein